MAVQLTPQKDEVQELANILSSFESSMAVKHKSQGNEVKELACKLCAFDIYLQLTKNISPKLQKLINELPDAENFDAGISVALQPYQYDGMSTGKVVIKSNERLFAHNPVIRECNWVVFIRKDTAGLLASKNCIDRDGADIELPWTPAMQTHNKLHAFTAMGANIKTAKTGKAVYIPGRTSEDSFFFLVLPHPASKERLSRAHRNKHAGANTAEDDILIAELADKQRDDDNVLNITSNFILRNASNFSSVKSCHKLSVYSQLRVVLRKTVASMAGGSGRESTEAFLQTCPLSTLDQCINHARLLFGRFDGANPQLRHLTEIPSLHNIEEGTLVTYVAQAEHAILPDQQGKKLVLARVLAKTEEVKESSVVRIDILEAAKNRSFLVPKDDIYSASLHPYYNNQNNFYTSQTFEYETMQQMIGKKTSPDDFYTDPVWKFKNFDLTDFPDLQLRSAIKPKPEGLSAAQEEPHFQHTLMPTNFKYPPSPPNGPDEADIYTDTCPSTAQTSCFQPRTPKRQKTGKWVWSGSTALLTSRFAATPIPRTPNSPIVPTAGVGRLYGLTEPVSPF